MKKLYKTLAVLTLAAGGLGLTQAAQAHDRLTVVYANSGYYSPGSYWKHRPAAPRYNSHGKHYGHSHLYHRHAEKRHHHDRHEHRDRDNRWSRDEHRDDRGRYADRHDNRANHSGYATRERH